MMDAHEPIPQIQVELNYATANNFTGQVVYNFQQCLLLKETALRLRDIQEELESMGLGLKIWDGFRPISAQRKLWELYHLSEITFNLSYVKAPRFAYRK